MSSSCELVIGGNLGVGDLLLAALLLLGRELSLLEYIRFHFSYSLNVEDREALDSLVVEAEGGGSVGRTEEKLDGASSGDNSLETLRIHHIYL